jgi:hypothetical protein
MISDNDTDPYYLMKSVGTTDVMYLLCWCFYNFVTFDVLKCTFDRARIARRIVLVTIYSCARSRLF